MKETKSNGTEDLEDLDYKFDRDNDGMYKEIMDKQDYDNKYYLGIKGIKKNKNIHLTHYKQVELSNNFVLKYYIKYQDNPQYEGQFVIKDKTKSRGEEDRYTIVSEKQAMDYIELFHQGVWQEWVNYKGYDDKSGKKGYIRKLMKEGKF